MRLFIIATVAIAFVFASCQDNFTAAVTSETNSTAVVKAISSDNNTSTFGDIEDSPSDDFSSDEISADGPSITSINTNAHGIGKFQISSDVYSDSSEEQEMFTRHATGKFVRKAHQQADRLLQCWEPVDLINSTSGFILSKPIFTLCSYIPLINSKENDFASFAVNGLELEYYDPLLLVFEDSEEDSEEDFKPIVFCAVEKLQLHKPPHPPSTAMRCLCNQSGCNVPKPLEEFLKFNRNVVPDTNNGTDLTDH